MDRLVLADIVSALLDVILEEMRPGECHSLRVSETGLLFSVQDNKMINQKELVELALKRVDQLTDILPLLPVPRSVYTSGRPLYKEGKLHMNSFKQTYPSVSIELKEEIKKILGSMRLKKKSRSMRADF